MERLHWQFSGTSQGYDRSRRFLHILLNWIVEKLVLFSSIFDSEMDL